MQADSIYQRYTQYLCKEFVLSVRQTTTFAADMPPFQCPRSSPFPDMAPVPGPKRHAGRRACPLPRCMPAVRNGRLPSASSSKMLAGSSDLCAATIKCTDCGHNRTARSAAAHEITPSSTTGMRCAAAADTDRTDPRYQTADLVQHVDRVIRVGFVKRQRRLDHCDFPLQTGR